MPCRVIVLGAGGVGALIGDDLARSEGLAVTVADASADRLGAAAARTGRALSTIQADLSDPIAIQRSVADFDIVVGALPGRLGAMALRAVIKAGKNYCDISFMPEDFLEADDAARERGVTALVDCGVAPGLSNILAARAVATLDECERVNIYVGGLPKHPAPPFHYKAAFSPTDVIEEYTRPARLVEGGMLVTREALSGVEPLTLPRVGELEAFNTDGLRSLATLGVPFMREKTLRYPGHASQMQFLRDIGLFESGVLRLQSGAQVRPREVAEALLFPHWQYEDGEADLTVMRVVAEGSRNGQRLRLTWDLYDEYDPRRRASSMARTTGYVCASIARMLVRGVIDRPGVIPPEQLGFDEAVFGTLMRDLSALTIDIHSQEEAVALQE